MAINETLTYKDDELTPTKIDNVSWPNPKSRKAFMLDMFRLEEISWDKLIVCAKFIQLWLNKNWSDEDLETRLRDLLEKRKNELEAIEELPNDKKMNLKN